MFNDFAATSAENTFTLSWVTSLRAKSVHRKSEKANADMELHEGVLLNLSEAALLVIL